MTNDETEAARTPPEHNPVKKWENSAKTSRTLAMKAMCAHCMGCTEERAEPGWKQLVKDCSATKCPLWEMRPFKSRIK